MNYFLLADTEFFRRINEAGDCNMETAYMAFANQVIELCGSIHASHTAIALAYIEIELQHHPVRLLSEERKEAAAYIGKALSFVRKMQKFLTTPQVPPLTSNIHSTNITAAETKAYKPIPVITDFTDEQGNDCMKEKVQENYNRIKDEVKQIVKDELERIASDESLKHLLQNK